MEILFIIPARSGSKGLPKKNMLPIAGKPLITWSIESAIKAATTIGNCDVLVSTDSLEIKEIAEKAGVMVPFLRPENLASDTASSISVVLHAIQFMEQQHKTYQYVALIEPTSPQRDEYDLINAYTQLKNNESAESIVGICQTENCHPLFLTKLNNGFLDPYDNKQYKTYRRQDIDEVYFFEGSMYISNVESLKKRNGFYHEKTLGYKMPKWKSFEIDDQIDFTIIEALLNAKNKNSIQ